MGRSPRTEEQIQKDLRTLTAFVEVFCREKHGGAKGAPCAECGDLLGYGTARLNHCPYDPKPKCKECETHCYKPDYRARMQEVMKFSGMHFVKRGRLDWLFKYFFSR